MAANRARDESRARQKALDELNKANVELQEERDRAESLYLAGQAAGRVSANPTQALLLALEGSKRLAGELTNNVILEALQADRELHVLEGFGEAIVLSAFSPNGKLAATAYRTGFTRLWDVESGRCVRILINPDRVPSIDISFSPDGQRLLTPTGAGVERRIYGTLQPASLSPSLRGHKPGIRLTSGSFSPRNDLVVTTSIDGTARLWRADDGSPVGKTLKRSRFRIGPSPDSIRTGNACWTVPDGRVYRFRQSQTGLYSTSAIRISSKPNYVRVHDVETGMKRYSWAVTRNVSSARSSAPTTSMC